MNTINGKPTGDITAQGARSSGEQWGHGKDTVSMTYEELAALWRSKDRHHGKDKDK